MKTNDFFDWAMSDVKGMKMPRGKKETIASFMVPIIEITEQNKFVNHLEKNDNKIMELKYSIETLLSSQNDILNKTII